MSHNEYYEDCYEEDDKYDVEALIRNWSMADISFELKALSRKIKNLEDQLKKERELQDNIFKESQQTSMNWVMAVVRGDLVPAKDVDHE